MRIGRLNSLLAISNKAHSYRGYVEGELYREMYVAVMKDSVWA
jgi:hypothetical protein